jgi:hypothetical protein
VALKGPRKSAANRKRIALLKTNPEWCTEHQQQNRDRQYVYRRRHPGRVKSNRPTELSINDLSRSVGFNPLPTPAKLADSTGWSDQIARVKSAWSPGQHLLDRQSYNRWWAGILSDLGKIARDHAWGWRDKQPGGWVVYAPGWNTPLDKARRGKAPHLDTWIGHGLAYEELGGDFWLDLKLLHELNAKKSKGERLERPDAEQLEKRIAPDPNVPYTDYRAADLLELTRGPDQAWWAWWVPVSVPDRHYEDGRFGGQPSHEECPWCAGHFDRPPPPRKAVQVPESADEWRLRLYTDRFGYEIGILKYEERLALSFNEHGEKQTKEADGDDYHDDGD